MNNYFELNISRDKLLALDLVESEQADVPYAPLYVLDTFKDMVAQRGYQPNEIKDRKDPMVVTGMSWFMREKVDEQVGYIGLYIFDQRREAMKKKTEDRRLRKLGESKRVLLQHEEDHKDADVFYLYILYIIDIRGTQQRSLPPLGGTQQGQ